MVNPPGDRNGGEVNAGETVRSIPTPFLTKTYQLVDDPAFDEIISWNEDGSAFVVRNPTEFARDLLPKYFKHNNFSSFVRQLNTYGFRKIVSDRWEFSNECFKKGEKSLLCDIHRRKVGAAVAVLGPVVPPVAAVAVAVAAVAVVPEQILPRISVSGTDSGDDQVISSTCSPGVVLREGGAASGSGSGTGPSTSSGTNAELIGENQQLRKDNLQLNKELCNMKSMCNNIYSLMANYSNNCNNSSNNNGKSSETVDTPMSNRMPTALDLMPARECTPEAEEMNTGGGESHRRVVDKTNAKLFGVSIGMKRGREEDNNRAAEHGKAVQDEQHDRMIKVEPLDDDDDDNQESHV